jgi:hypothetical protein
MTWSLTCPSGDDGLENFLVILAVGAGAFVVAFAFAALSSERMSQSVFVPLWRQITRRRRNTYRG